jgi:hypothetical protein
MYPHRFRYPVENRAESAVCFAVSQWLVLHSQQELCLDVKFIILDDNQLIYHSPLPPGDVAALENLLRESNCLIPSFVDADAYSVETYIVEYAWKQTETTFLFDRNLYSQVVALAKGDRATDKARCAAAIMAFASCANAQIEPNLALYEGSASGARLAWKRDLEIFHRADNIHPANWAALALGYAEGFDRRIPGKRLRSERAKSFDPTMKLRFYGRVYPTVLKMAIISRLGGRPDKKIIELLDWMYHSWYFNAPATLLATQALSHDPPKDVFKNIGSTDRKRALAGVKNAAWDLVYIIAWYEKIKTQKKANHLTVLCSNDRVFLKVAELLRSATFDETVHPFEKSGFGRSVLDRYNTYVSDLSNPKRAVKSLTADSKNYRNKLVSDLESEFLKPL